VEIERASFDIARNHTQPTQAAKAAKEEAEKHAGRMYLLALQENAKMAATHRETGQRERREREREASLQAKPKDPSTTTSTSSRPYPPRSRDRKSSRDPANVLVENARRQDQFEIRCYQGLRENEADFDSLTEAQQASERQRVRDQVMRERREKGVDAESVIKRLAITPPLTPLPTPVLPNAGIFEPRTDVDGDLVGGERDGDGKKGGTVEESAVKGGNEKKLKLTTPLLPEPVNLKAVIEQRMKELMLKRERELELQSEEQPEVQSSKRVRVDG